MVRVEYLVQHHPSRSETVEKLVADLPKNTRLIASNETPANPWMGYQSCLRSMSPRSTHVCIIQDDATVCANFHRTLNLVAEANPITPVVLFLSRLPARISNLALKAAKRREHYIRTQLRINEFMPVVAVLWPQHKVQEFLHWTQENPHRLGHPEPRSDDGVTGRWCALTKQTVTFTVPSLVEHPDQVSSVIGKDAKWGKDKARVALMLVEGDPLEIDWS